MAFANIATGTAIAGSLAAGGYGGYRAHQSFTDHGSRDTGPRVAGSVGGAAGLFAGGVASIGLAEVFAGMDVRGNSKVLNVLTGVAALGGLAAMGAGVGTGVGLLKNGGQDAVGAIRD